MEFTKNNTGSICQTCWYYEETQDGGWCHKNQLPTEYDNGCVEHIGTQRRHTCHSAHARLRSEWQKEK